MRIKVETWLVKGKKKRYIVAREKGIVARRKYSSNANKRSEAIKEIQQKAFRDYQKGKVKSLDTKYGNTVLITHKDAMNQGLLKENRKNIPKDYEGLSIQVHRKFFIKLENGFTATGWGHSFLHYIRTNKEWTKDNETSKRVKANSEAYINFLASKEVPYDIPIVELKVLQENFSVYR